MDTPLYRWQPKDSETLTDDESGAVVFTYTIASTGKAAAIGYRARQSKTHAFHNVFANSERRSVAIINFFQIERDRKQQKATDRQKRAEYIHDYQVGDVLYNSWGWEQTNVDFYQVVRVPSARTIAIRAIEANATETGWLSGTCVPMPGSFKGPELIKRVGQGGHIAMEYGGCGRWEGRPVYWSAYA